MKILEIVIQNFISVIYTIIGTFCKQVEVCKTLNHDAFTNIHTTCNEILGNAIIVSKIGNYLDEIPYVLAIKFAAKSNIFQIGKSLENSKARHLNPKI